MARPAPAQDLPDWVLDALVTGPGATPRVHDPLDVQWHEVQPSR
jgi:hypothetical protein